MKITLVLVKHCVELGLDVKNLDVATRDENAIRSFCLEKMASGALTPAKFAELTSKADEDAAASLITKAVAEANGANDAKFDVLTKSVTALTDLMSKIVTGGMSIPANAPLPSGQKAMTDVGAAAALFGGVAPGNDGANADGSNVRVKCISEMFNKSCKALTYDMSPNERVSKHLKGVVMTPAGDGHRELTTQSELDREVSGAWFKHMVNRTARHEGRSVPACFKMNERDNRLVEYAVNNSRFIGPIGHKSEDGDQATHWTGGQKLFTDFHKKALLDDTSSGGLEAVPIEFDSAIITQAILTGELFPFITVQTTARRRIEGASVGNVNFSNTAEGTALTPFNTANFIAAFDTSIFPIVGSMEMGLDFLDDSPVSMAGIVSERYSEGFKNRLDQLVASGTGIGEMLGLNATTGLTSVTSTNGTGGPSTVSDYEGLLFGVPKAYRQEAGKARSVFLSNDTTYRRLRGIQVGASDQRRVYGMDHESYMTHEHPHKISEIMANTEAGFFCLNRYRAYRRQGYTVRIETAGATLANKNQQLIIVRARFGGQLELGSAGSRCTTMQT